MFRGPVELRGIRTNVYLRPRPLSNRTDMPATLTHRQAPTVVKKIARAGRAPIFRFKKERAAFVRETFEGVAGLLD